MSPDRQLVESAVEAPARTLKLYADLPDTAMLGPKLASVNPPLWELGHIAFFQQFWVLHDDHGHELYDSARVAHDTRWELPLPSRADTLSQLRRLRDQVLEAIERGTAADYFVRLSVFHEDMHDEALTYTRQTLGYPP